MDTTTSSPTSFGRFVAAAAAALTIAAAALLGGAAPASAHDELLSTDPAADSSLDAVPAQLTLTFSGQLLGEAGATEVQATDAAGTSLTDGTPLVQDNVVVQALTGEASGLITVLWRTVSSDGHPISGQFGFTVSPAPAPAPTATATPEPTPTETPSATPTETVTPAPDAPSDSAAPAAWPWILVGLAAAALLGGIVYLLVSRARREKALAKASQVTDQPGSEPSA